VDQVLGANVAAHAEGRAFMDEDSYTDIGDGSGEPGAGALLDRVAAAMAEIEQAKRERSTDEMRAARVHLAALHGVACLRRESERRPRAA
jgi:hypothetical protein